MQFLLQFANLIDIEVHFYFVYILPTLPIFLLLPRLLRVHQSRIDSPVEHLDSQLLTLKLVNRRVEVLPQLLWRNYRKYILFLILFYGERRLNNALLDCLLRQRA